MMRKECPARSMKSAPSAMLLDRLFGNGAAKSLTKFLAKSTAEKALATSKSRVRVLERKLDVAKRTASAVHRVRRKQRVSAEMELVSLTSQLNDVSVDRDLLLTANAELLVRAKELEFFEYDQKRMLEGATETNSLVAECAEALIKADPDSFKRIFKSPGTSASRILVTSITKVINQRTLPGGKSKTGRKSPSSW